MAALPEPFNSTVSEIYRYYENREQWRSKALSPSALGTDCDRALWYEFRWTGGQEHIDGRKQRLFATGHREEARLVQDLKTIGVHVQDFDPATGKQWVITALAGHVRGKIDGVAHGFPEAPMKTHVLECKTHNEKSFKELVSKGVKAAKPNHYRQMMAYMHFGGWDRAFYLAQNKNTDELYSERVNYDPVEGSQIALRMERIVTAQEPSPKIADKPDFFQCKFCAKADICHAGQWPLRSCRTCLHSTPDIVSGGWTCAKDGGPIDDETMPVGCTSHLFIPALVPGEQTDADEAAQTVTYRLRTGGTWIDGARA